MALVQVSARLDPDKLKRARKPLGTQSTTETIQKALDLMTERAAHDWVIQRYSGVGKRDAFNAS